MHVPPHELICRWSNQHPDLRPGMVNLIGSWLEQRERPRIHGKAETLRRSGIQNGRLARLDRLLGVVRGATLNSRLKMDRLNIHRHPNAPRVAVSRRAVAW